MVASSFGFPRSAEEIDVTVSFEHSGATERWTRTFGTQELTSHQFEGAGRFERLLCEKFGPFTFGLALVVDSDRLLLVARRWSVFGIPLPRFLVPKGNACEFDQNGTFHFDVEIKAPLIGLIVRYVGYLEPQ